jgi:hypothetical protein
MQSPLAVAAATVTKDTASSAIDPVVGEQTQA